MELSFWSKILLQGLLGALAVLTIFDPNLAVVGAIVAIILIVDAVGVHSSARTFFRNQLFVELAGIVNLLRYPVLPVWYVPHPVWDSKSEDNKSDLLGKRDYVSFRVFYERIRSWNRTYSNATPTELNDPQYDVSRREIIAEARQLFNTLSWLTVRASEID